MQTSVLSTKVPSKGYLLRGTCLQGVCEMAHQPELESGSVVARQAAGMGDEVDVALRGSAGSLEVA